MSSSPAASPPAASHTIDADTWRVATVLILGSIMSILDTTIVNVALETLSRDLHAKLSDVQWVVTGYLLALAAVIPVAAWAARRLGPRRLYLTSIVLFTAGSALCGLAHSTDQLILFRVLQGVGGGMIMPVGQMILVKAAGPQKLARVMAAMGVPVVAAPVLGPTLGGFLLDDVGWRWIFFINIPIGVVAIVTGLRRLPSEPPRPAGRFDLLGLALIATGLVSVTYGLTEVAQPGLDRYTHVLLPLAVGAVLVTVFALRALGSPQPLLDLRIYANKACAAAAITIFSLGAVLYGAMILMPLYFQTVRGEDAVYTGLLLAPRGMGAAVASWLGGRMTDRLGAGVTSAIGGVVSLTFTLPFVRLGGHTSYAFICSIMVLQGLGIGLSATPAFTAAYRALGPAQIGDAAPQLNIVMRIGGSIGTAILTVVLQHHLVRAGGSLPARAAAFGTTFWWVIAATAVAVVPTAMLIFAERRAGAGALPDGLGPAATDQPTLEVG